MTRPYFRIGNAIKFQNDSKKNDLLINPHEALNNPESNKYLNIFNFELIINNLKINLFL